MASNITYWHDWPSNFSDGTLAVNGMGRLFQYANQVTDGFLGFMIAIMVFIISFVITKSTSSTSNAVAIAGFFTSLISILLFRVGMVGIGVPIVLAGIATVGVLFSRADKQ